MTADDLHELCEETKRRFDAGEIIALTLVTVNHDGGVTISNGGAEIAGLALVGALEIAQDRVKTAFPIG